MPCYEGIEQAFFTGGALTDPTGAAVITLRDGCLRDTHDGEDFVVFEVQLKPLSTGAVAVDYATSNGSAQAGQHYQNSSGTLNIPAGESTGLIKVPALGRHADRKGKEFTVTLSSPGGATIGSGTATGHFYECSKVGGDREGQNGRLRNLEQRYISYPAEKAFVYDQFLSCYTYNQCTAHAVALALSVDDWVNRHRAKSQYNAAALFSAAGGSPCTQAQCASSSCSGFYIGSVLSQAISSGASNISHGGSGQLSYYSIISVGSSYSGTAQIRKSELIYRIKVAIKRHGIVLIDSSWYVNWNRGGVGPGNKFILPPPVEGNRTVNHSYGLIGWTQVNGRDCFIMQNSGGRRWAKSGRAHLPFAYINPDSNTGSSHPYYRFYQVDL